jgi:hypothetical protein
MYQVAVEFQTLIAGLIGFAGIVISLLLSAKLARNQRRSERSHDANGVRTAINAELALAVEIFSHAVKKQEGKPFSGVYLIPVIKLGHVYRTLSDKLPLLNKNELEKIIRAYSIIETHYAKLTVIGSLTIDGFHIQIENNYANLVDGLTRNVSSSVAEARAEIAKDYVE